ncbi:MAG: hypothetical protein HQL95_09815 [Magnetococcales bacterium]|nr:hypothetical protein [Magnetococcales bacterium]
MEDENGNDERSESPQRKAPPAPASNSKMISVIVGVVVLLVAMLQFTRMSQRQMRELEMENVLQQNRAQEEFREKAQKKRYDINENNKQAEMLESQFKPLNQTGHPKEP